MGKSHKTIGILFQNYCNTILSIQEKKEPSRKINPFHLRKALNILREGYD